MVVLIIKQVAIFTALYFAEKNIWESTWDYSKGSTVNFKDFKTDAG
jgi:hypothetical protein